MVASPRRSLARTVSSDRSSLLRRSASLRRLVPYGLFILAYGLSIAASWYLSTNAAATAEARARTEFVTDAQSTRRQIQARLDAYFEIVRAGAVLVSADNEINGAEFRRFVAGLELRERYPGLDGIGFVQCVGRRRIQTLLRSVSLDGTPLTLWPDGEREVYALPSCSNQPMPGIHAAWASTCRPSPHSPRRWPTPATGHNPSCHHDSQPPGLGTGSAGHRRVVHSGLPDGCRTRRRPDRGAH